MRHSRPFISIVSLLGLLLALLAPGQGRAQSIANYTDTTYVGLFSYLLGDSTLTPTGTFDDDQYRIATGFPFRYGTNEYGRVNVSTNGYVKLGTTITNNGGGGAYVSSSIYKGNILNQSNGDNNILAALNMDLFGRTGRVSKISIRRAGQAPNRSLIIQWLNMHRYATVNEDFDDVDSLDFQVVLQESGAIEFRYGRMLASDDKPLSCQMGLRGINRTNLLSMHGDDLDNAFRGNSPTDTVAFNDQSVPEFGRIYRFMPPPPAPFDAAVLGLVLAVSPKVGCAYTTSEPVGIRVQNLGTVPMDSVPVGVAVNGVVKTMMARFTPALTTRQEGIATLAGANGADFSQFIPYTVKAFVDQPGDTAASNDTVRQSFRLKPPVEALAIPAAATFAELRSRGWYQGEGWPEPTDSLLTNWEVDNTYYPGTYANYVATTSDPNTWLYRPGLQVPGPFGIRFRLAISDAFDTDLPLDPIEDDTMKVMYRTCAGGPWQMLTSFSQADLTSGRISNVFKEFTVGVPATGPGVYSVAFVVDDNGTGASDSYMWHLDDLRFVAAINLQADAAIQPFVPTNLVIGSCSNEVLPIQVAVTNTGATAMDTVVLGYRYNDGPVYTQTFLSRLGISQRDTFSFSAANLVAPGASGTVRLRIFTINSRDAQASNDTIRLSFLITPAQSMTNSPAAGLNALTLAGYSQATTRQALPGSSVFLEGTTFGPSDRTAAYTANAANLGSAGWLISPMYRYSVHASLYFNVAITAGLTGTGAVANIGSDSLKVLYRQRCGAWQTMYTFTQADLASGGIINRLRPKGFDAPAGAPDSLQFAFMVARGTTSTVTYRWHINQVRVADEPLAARPSLRLPELSLFPVPARERLEVAFGKTLAKASLRVTDLSGRTLMAREASGANATLDVNALSGGLYLLTVETPDGQVTRPFTVQR